MREALAPEKARLPSDREPGYMGASQFLKAGFQTKAAAVEA